MQDLAAWLGTVGLGKYAEVFVDNALAFDVLAQLTEADLKEPGIPLGDRKRLLSAIESRDDGASPSEISPAAAPSTSPGDAERRQLTVMFCDLVGATELSQRLDSEDLRDLMRRYQDAVAGAVTYWRRAGERAAAMASGQERLSHFERAPELIQDLEHLRIGIGRNCRYGWAKRGRCS